jgi:cell division protein FtsI/penicillin-binding protein 2
MQDALNWSFNTGMVTIAERLGDGTSITQQARNTIYTYFHDKLRLGQSTGIELANEAHGTIIPPTDVQGNAVRYSNMVFGQGMNVTMLQVSAALSTVINGGTYRTPSIVAGTVDDSGTFTAAKPKASYDNVIKPSSSSVVRDMVYKARKEFYAGADKKGYYIGGKTGTSQTLENGKYVDNQTIGTYLGFGGEIDQMPRYVIMVELSGKDMNLQGGTDAMPIFTDISNWMIDYLKLQPKG